MLPTDLNFFAPNYCSDPFFSQSNFLRNEETEEFIDEFSSSVSSEEIVNDAEMTPSQKHKKLYKLILEKKTEEATNFYRSEIANPYFVEENFLNNVSDEIIKFYEKEIPGSFLEESSKKDCLDHISKTREIVDEFQKKLIEKTGARAWIYEKKVPLAFSHESSGPRYYYYRVLPTLSSFVSSSSALDKQDLLPLQLSLAEISNSLQKYQPQKSESTELYSPLIWKTSLIALTIIPVFSHGNLRPLATSLVALPLFEAPKHLFGATSAVVASAAGCEFTTAIGIGISMSLLAHKVPAVASLFERTVIRTSPALKMGIKSVATGTELAAKGIVLATMLPVTATILTVEVGLLATELTVIGVALGIELAAAGIFLAAALPVAAAALTSKGICRAAELTVAGAKLATKGAISGFNRGVKWLDAHGAFDNRAARLASNIINTVSLTTLTEVDQWIFE